MLTYADALDYLYSFVDYGALRSDQYSPEAFDLGRMAGFLRALGQPHERYPVLHIAGTKGKGSVAALSACALQAGGYRTALYTSPHLIDFRERVQVDGALIAREAVAELVADLQALVPQHPGLTTFELTTALALLYFAREAVDVAVLEVGLGGRLDATNVVTPRVSVITSLSYDHVSLLGRSLGEIAGEKAGIIKPGVPVVAAPQQPQALAVVERVAAERGAPLSLVGRDWLYQPVERSLDGQALEVWSAREQLQLAALRAEGHARHWRPTRLEVPLLGQHQVENAVVAYAALNELRDQGLPLSPDAVRSGLRAVHWPGRFEVLARQPFVVVDGAHNADSARRLAATVEEYFPGRPVTLIFGASSDKDVAGMLSELLRPAVGITRILLTQAVHPRAQDPTALAALVQAQGRPAEVVPSVAQALDYALQLTGSDEVILACGSLFVVAEARAAWLARRPMAEPVTSAGW